MVHYVVGRLAWWTALRTNGIANSTVYANCWCRDSRPRLAWPYRRRQMCVLSLAGPSFSFLPACHLSSSFESPRHLTPGFQEHPERYEDPQHIEEDQVQPQVDWVVALQLGISAQPFRTKGHKSAVQLSSRQ